MLRVPGLAVTGQRERQRQREGEREGGGEKEREREREGERDGAREGERELLFLFLKGMAGPLASFSYLV
jgi:hypothetical protein